MGVSTESLNGFSKSRNTDGQQAPRIKDKTSKEKEVRRIDDSLPFLGNLFESGAGKVPELSSSIDQAISFPSSEPDKPQQQLRRTKVFYVNNTRYEYEY